MNLAADSLFMSNPDPMWIYDLETLRFLAVNKSAIAKYGYTRAEFLAMTIADIRPAEDRAALARNVAAVTESRGESGTWRHCLKSGEVIHVDITGHTITHDGRRAELVAARDVSRLVLAEQAAQAALAREEAASRELARGNWLLEIAGTSAKFGAWRYDIHSHQIEWSPQTARIHDEPEGVSPTVEQGIAYYAPEYRDRIATLFQACLHDGIPFAEELEIISAKGRRLWVRTTGEPERDDAGRIVAVRGSFQDISERRQLEDRLRQAQKMEAVGQLTGGVAHDFNNLLTVVLGNADALSDELKEQPHLQTMAEMTANAAMRGAELTNRLLAFSRKQALKPQVLDVGQLIQGMDGLLRRTLPEHIEIEIVQSGGLWKTEVDPGQLESALLNLALNARDAMPDGGALTIEVANAALDDAYVASELDVEAGQYVLIVVTDTGPGMPEETMNRIFEPFFTTKDVGKGSGLGLSMVYGFVKQSRGHIRVYSEIGEGTAFKLYFSRARAKQDRAHFDVADQTIAGGQEVILVVEDNGVVRDHVVTQLKGLGYGVLQASEGAEALEILQQGQRIDLLFTDVVLSGGMGGREVAAAARERRPDIKILFTSGYTQNSIVHNGKLDPGVDLLSKPYRREQLALKLRKVLDRT